MALSSARLTLTSELRSNRYSFGPHAMMTPCCCAAVKQAIFGDYNTFGQQEHITREAQEAYERQFRDHKCLKQIECPQIVHTENSFIVAEYSFQCALWQLDANNM